MGISQSNHFLPVIILCALMLPESEIKLPDPNWKHSFVYEFMFDVCSQIILSLVI